LRWRDRAFVLRAFIIVERRQKYGIFQAPDLALNPLVRFIASNGAGITAEIKQLAWYAGSSYKLRSIREHTREFVTGAAPQCAVDEQVTQRLFCSQRLFQLARVAIDLLGRRRHQRLLHVLAGPKHVLQMQRRQLHAPGVGERVP